MCDGFLVLAQAPGGLTCLLMPRRLADGDRNAFRLMRLKDKLGDWANASSEVEFCGAQAWRVGEEGRGVATIIGMVMMTRLDCMLGAAAEMRMALAQALHHARHRRTFGKLLVEHPLMTNVLADLALESEAATVLSMRIARAVDRAGVDAKRSCAGTGGNGAGQVLAVQARTGLRQRSAGMPRRRRLCGGIDAAAAVPAGAVEFDLGR